MTHETPGPESVVVNVRRQPADRLRADYRLSDIFRMEWGYFSGGRSRRTQWHVYGYVMCDAMISGKVGHSCKHGPPPHKIRICVTKKHNEKIWPVISEKVGPKPMPRRSKRRLKRLRRRQKRRMKEVAARV